MCEQLSELEVEIKVYKARYNATTPFFCSLLGICESAFINKVKGRRAFTAFEAFTLAETLGMEPSRLYAILPEINHRAK